MWTYPSIFPELIFEIYKLQPFQNHSTLVTIQYQTSKSLREKRQGNHSKIMTSLKNHYCFSLYFNTNPSVCVVRLNLFVSISLYMQQVISIVFNISLLCMAKAKKIYSYPIQYMTSSQNQSIIFYCEFWVENNIFNFLQQSNFTPFFF